AKAVAQALFERETLWPRKGLAGGLQGSNARRDKGANIFAQMVVSEQVPLAIDIGQVIRVDQAQLGFVLARFAVSEPELAAGGGGLGQLLEHSQIQDGLRPGPKGDRLFRVR